MHRYIWVNIGLLVTLIFTVTNCSHEAGRSNEPPSWIVNTICRPSFETADGNFSAGTAFVLRNPSHQTRYDLLVTAHHLFGPDGGLKQHVKWADLASFVTSVRCESMQDANRVLVSGHPLTIVGAHAFSEPGEPRDIAAFIVISDSSTKLSLSDEQIEKGQTVWLLARVLGGEAPTKLLHRAQVLSVSDRLIVFEYQNPNLDLTATSGAPIVNVYGEVIATNIGILRKRGVLMGVGMSASIIKNVITSALAPE